MLASLKESINKKILFQWILMVILISLSKNDFIDIINPILNETFDIVTNAITESKLSSIDIKNIILVGGSTRIDCIKTLLEKKFSCGVS